MLDSHQLNVFLIASETLNYTAAAQRLGMSQPSVSQHVQALEQHFQNKLFVRRGRQMVLTDAGEALVPLARKMVDWSNHIEESMNSLQGELHGHLKVSCSSSEGQYVLPILFAEFIRRHPKVTARCQPRPRKAISADLFEGLVHLALGAREDFSPSLELLPLLSDPIDLIVPLSHPWRENGMIQPNDLIGADIILCDLDTDVIDVVTKGLAETGVRFDRLKATLILATPIAVTVAVAQGLGIGFVPRIVHSRLSRRQVAAVQIEGFASRLEPYLGRNPLGPRSAILTSFWDFVNDERYLINNQLAQLGFEGTIG